MTPRPTFVVNRNQAGTYTLTCLYIGRGSFSVHLDTLEQIEALALEILDAVRFQRALDADR